MGVGGADGVGVSSGVSVVGGLVVASVVVVVMHLSPTQSWIIPSLLTMKYSTI